MLLKSLDCVGVFNKENELPWDKVKQLVKPILEMNTMRS